MDKHGLEGILAYYGCSPLEMEQAFSSEKMVAVELELTMLHGDIKGEDGRIFDPKTQKLCPYFWVETTEEGNSEGK